MNRGDIFSEPTPTAIPDVVIWVYGDQVKTAFKAQYGYIQLMWNISDRPDGTETHYNENGVVYEER